MRIPSNKIRDIRRFMKMELGEVYDEKEIDVFAEILFEAFAGIIKTKLYMMQDATVSESVLLKLNTAIKKLKLEIPIAYIVGYTYFLNLRISVSKHVLIPRPETEELVIRVKELLFEKQTCQILDAATGSGCIALALKNYLPHAEIYGFDSSEEALELAKKNSSDLGLPLILHVNNMFDFSFHYPTIQFDAIVCNPPYVAESEKRLMKRNVLDYEPPQALFVPDETPLIFYTALAELGNKFLKKDGFIFCEINENFGKQTAALFKNYKYRDVDIINDINDKNRFVIAKKIKI